MNTVERRIPAADRWAREVTSVSPRAKTGHDITGEWLQGGRLTDLKVGALVLVCNDVGSRKRPCDEVDLYVVLPDGYDSLYEQGGSGLYYATTARGREWAVALRETLVDWLSLTPTQRVARALAELRDEARDGLDDAREVADRCAAQIEIVLGKAQAHFSEHKHPVSVPGIDADGDPHAYYTYEQGAESLRQQLQRAAGEAAEWVQLLERRAALEIPADPDGRAAAIASLTTAVDQLAAAVDQLRSAGVQSDEIGELLAQLREQTRKLTC